MLILRDAWESFLGPCHFENVAPTRSSELWPLRHGS